MAQLSQQIQMPQSLKERGDSDIKGKKITNTTLMEIRGKHKDCQGKLLPGSLQEDTKRETKIKII